MVSLRRGWNHTGWPLSSTIRGASWLGPVAPGSIFGETKMEPGAAVARACVVTLTAGGLNSGREWKAHACSPRVPEAIARAPPVRSQPKVAPSATHAVPAPTACKNLRRDTSLPKPAPLLAVTAATEPLLARAR